MDEEMDTSFDLKDVSTEIPDDTSSEIPEDIPEDVPEDSSPEGDYDVLKDIPEDVPEDVPEDSSPDGDYDVPEDIPEDVPEDVPEDSSPEGDYDVPEDIPEDVPEDVPEDSSPEEKSDVWEDFPEDVPEEQPTDTRETEAVLPNDARNDTSPDQAEQETEGNQPVDSQESETDIPTNTETEDTLVVTNNESSSDAVSDEFQGTAEPSAFDQLSDYMNRHNYGQQDYDTYSQDPEWQALHRAAFPEAHEDASGDVPSELPEGETPTDTQEPEADTTSDTEERPENAAEQLEAEQPEDFQETGIPTDTVSEETQKPRVDNPDNLRRGEETDFPESDLPNERPVSNAFNALSNYMNEHNYSAQDYSVYSQDPEWRALHREAFPDSELPPLTQENAFHHLSEYMNRHNYGQQDLDTYSQDPAWRELESAAFPEYELPPIRSKEYASILEKMDDAKVAYRPVELAAEQRSEADIINELGGGDLTEGSCSSLAFAYAGNKAGYNVLDFRDGNSRSFFSENASIQTIAELPGVDSRISYGTNDIACANNLLSGMEDGKEYYLATGLHAAIVKRAEDGYRFLELQSPDRTGWKPLDNDTLTYRFGCSSDSGYELPNFLIDVDSLGRSSEFRNVLGYINTAGNNQIKGGEGRVR